MKKERYWPVLGTWLKDTATTPPDPQQTARKVAERLPQTRQVRRRWWLPSLRRTDHQATPIPTTNGHAPTVIGRTQSMLSPAKAITAGALVFALGGVLLIAQPFDRQGGSVPGAATDTQPEAPVSVTGSAQPGPCPQSSKYEVVGDVLQERGGHCNPHWTMSDSRLSGTATWMGTTDTYEDGSALSVGYRALSVENDDGVWREVPQVIIDFPGAVDTDTRVTVFEGEGGYEGLVAVLEATETDSGATYAGFIFDGGLPPIPENPSSE